MTSAGSEIERPLRILYVLSKLERSWRGGIGRVTTASIRALAERGHEMHIAGRARDGGAPSEVPGATLHAWPGALGKLSQLPFLLNLQRRIRADVVHFHSSLPHGALIVPFLALRPLVGRPAVVVTPHTGSRGDFPKRWSRLALRRVDAVIGPTEWSARRAVEAGAPSQRTHVIWNGVDRVVERESCDERRVVLGLGRLVPSKGFDVLLEAFERASRTRRDWQLVVAGDGRELRPLRQRAERLESGERIFLPGFVSGRERDQLFAQAAIGVVPSRTDMIPGAMLELQAHGIATIASAVGAVPEGADGGKAAVLVPPEDVEALARELASLMDHPERRASLGRNARAVSRERLWPRIAEELETVYREVCS